MRAVIVLMPPMPVSSRSTISTFQRRAFRVALVHAEELAGEERGLVAARAGPDLEEDVAGVVGVLRQEQHLELLLDGRQALRERRALGGRHLVQLVARRQRFHQLARPLELLPDLPVLLHQSDHRLEVGQRLLGLAHGAVVLDELGVGEAGLDLVVFAADFFEFFEHRKIPGRPLSGRPDGPQACPLQGGGGEGARRCGGHSPRRRRRKSSSRSVSGSARRGRPSRRASVSP